VDKNFIVYKRYSSKDEAIDFVRLLNDNQIESETIIDKLQTDMTFANNEHEVGYIIKILEQDFEKVNRLLENNAISLNDLDETHYIFDFSNDELYNILLQYDEWGDGDVALAKQLLKKRGERLDKGWLESIKAQRLRQLAQPRESPMHWIVIGYFLAFFSGLIGFLIGLHLFALKHPPLPDGKKIHAYSPKDRRQGLIIMIFGIISFIIGFRYWFLSNY